MTHDQMLGYQVNNDQTGSRAPSSPSSLFIPILSPSLLSASKLLPPLHTLHYQSVHATHDNSSSSLNISNRHTRQCLKKKKKSHPRPRPYFRTTTVSIYLLVAGYVHPHLAILKKTNILLPRVSISTRYAAAATPALASRVFLPC